MEAIEFVMYLGYTLLAILLLLLLGLLITAFKERRMLKELFTEELKEKTSYEKLKDFLCANGIYFKYLREFYKYHMEVYNPKNKEALKDYWNNLKEDEKLNPDKILEASFQWGYINDFFYWSNLEKQLHKIYEGEKK